MQHAITVHDLLIAGGIIGGILIVLWLAFRLLAAIGDGFSR